MRLVFNGVLTEKDKHKIETCKAAFRAGLIDWLEIVHDGIVVYCARRGTK